MVGIIDLNKRKYPIDYGFYPPDESLIWVRQEKTHIYYARTNTFANDMFRNTICVSGYRPLDEEYGTLRLSLYFGDLLIQCFVGVRYDNYGDCYLGDSKSPKGLDFTPFFRVNYKPKKYTINHFIYTNDLRRKFQSPVCLIIEPASNAYIRSVGTYGDPMDILVVENPNLNTLTDFLPDPQQYMQEVSMWLANKKTETELAKSQSTMTDPQKILSHGFDLKTSFRGK